MIQAILEWALALLIISGSFFGFTAALGLVRMRDIYLRMSTSGKGATLCCGLLLIGVALLFQDTGVTARAVAAILFLLLTVPVGAHMIARAAFRTGTPMWDGESLNSPRKGLPNDIDKRGSD
ncbi:monovalent cation/H(+) antiporter subunit G [Microbulbifer agarilyticus]|uniref:monovalent cation/H(+) antiporter subunit G n=1 Tax=Microbulbifer agarilyticus TaxID=260552 RepID=UPI001C97993E|nr:monovalent cation/H(+) antiporter subunit G [Microbulbifer agarilyticus]MBY6190133.1 monovalent cation/H(+) antiporter subunit G [Microbulbifer agarilyticus]MBY6210136.1 monovalent cation/H(+) antiporter subunit G [Microbulbifer agarilyticus]MCA0892626.1 monovalent cation/H(+) antiporter subunit G [Microbulbifer agarilyticus]